jgi:type III secretory pathway component EscS
MDPAELVSLAQDGLILSVAVALPVVGIAAVVGLLSGLLQSITRVYDPAIGHLPRLVAVGAALAVLGPWMGAQIAAFAARAFGAH